MAGRVSGGGAAALIYTWVGGFGTGAMGRTHGDCMAHRVQLSYGTQQKPTERKVAVAQAAFTARQGVRPCGRPGYSQPQGWKGRIKDLHTRHLSVGRSSAHRPSHGHHCIRTVGVFSDSAGVRGHTPTNSSSRYPRKLERMVGESSRNSWRVMPFTSLGSANLRPAARAPGRQTNGFTATCAWGATRAGWTAGGS